MKKKLSDDAVHLVDDLLVRAIQSRASDLHFEPQPDGMAVRMRVDGVLRPLTTIPLEQKDRVTLRLKVLAGMDVSESRKPQDGRATVDRTVHLRVSTLPTVQGEAVAVRILDESLLPDSAEALGIEGYMLNRYRALLKTGAGLILIAGPTGAGKSSTLYQMLTDLDRERLNIVTLEDPVEYNMTGANQVAIHDRFGMTFSLGMRSVLRQDPDVIVIGEIRDAETAEIACRAAITGHLTLATVHTQNASALPERMREIGISDSLAAQVLRGLVLQRLVRRVCEDCHGDGCDGCGQTGFKGRTGVFSVQTFTGARQVTTERLREADAALQARCRDLISRHITTEQEAERVLEAL